MSIILEKARAGERFEFDIIDLHGHLGEIFYGLADNNCDALVEDMDRAGVRCILTSHMHCFGAYPEKGNEEVHKLIQPHKDRIYGYACFWPSKYEEVKARAEYWYSQGFIGQKFHNSNGIPYHHPAYDGAYEVANKHKMVILFHVFGAEKTLSEISEVSKKYPETSILLAHAGSNNDDAYIEMSKKHDNVYLDIALSRTRVGLVKYLVDKAGADKVTFGSDALFFSLGHQIGKVTGADISDTDKEKILCRNAEKILERIC